MCIRTQLELKEGFKFIGLEIYPIYGDSSSGDSKFFYYFANGYTGIFAKHISIACHFQYI